MLPAIFIFIFIWNLHTLNIFFFITYKKHIHSGESWDNQLGHLEFWRASNIGRGGRNYYNPSRLISILEFDSPFEREGSFLSWLQITRIFGNPTDMGMVKKFTAPMSVKFSNTLEIYNWLNLTEREVISYCFCIAEIKYIIIKWCIVSQSDIMGKPYSTKDGYYYYFL